MPNFAGNYGKSASFAHFGTPTATTITPDGVPG